MMAQQIADAAEKFLQEIASVNLKVSSHAVKADAGRFCDIFRNKDEAEQGAYWFFTTDGTVYDIGKASDNTIWRRICAHAPLPKWFGDPTAKYLGTTGDGWGFPTSTHLNDKTSDDVRTHTKNGTFHVGWVAVQPANLATLVEVYLQTLCLTVDGKLPEFVYKIG